ncbi:MAG: hypothetical protein AB1486_13660 [Planctomycetota bacterium]
MLRLCAWLAAFAILGASPAGARTWLVGGPGADFSEIQAAIDAASDGDVILVRPGSYAAFTLSKGVVVRSSTDPFSIQGNVFVTHVSAGLRAGVAGMALQGALHVLDSAGEIALGDVSIVADDDTGLEIRSCVNVSVDELSAVPDGVSDRSYEAGHQVLVTASRVRFSAYEVRGAEGRYYPTDAGARGGSAFWIEDSVAVLARGTAIGGRGGLGGYFGWIGALPGGDGGEGVRSIDSGVVVLGSASNRLEGGRGGDGGWDPYSGSRAQGGNGGSGFAGFVGVVSLVELRGGAGGDDGGAPGDAWWGNVVEDHRFPYLDMSNDLHPGGEAGLDLTAVEAGTVLLVASTQGGFLSLPRADGPPLSAVPGALFLVVSAGTIGAGATQSYSFSLPSDSLLQGLAFVLQALQIADSGAVLLANAVTRIIKE